jgi:hypothetical protein
VEWLLDFFAILLPGTVAAWLVSRYLIEQRWKATELTYGTAAVLGGLPGAPAEPPAAGGRAAARDDD